MKLIGVEMKPIRVANPNVGIKMNVNGGADLNVEVKMIEIRVGMKPTGVSTFDAEVKINEPDLLNPDINVKNPVGMIRFCSPGFQSGEKE